ncbi:GAP1-N1 domain-containing protein [Flavobacterium poyangense]|uniref:GAP1-N1 domain-containing protein n=1 Tax=Flavobacterium poyangense TaxID=2204302 RepID=UPI0014227097|nr:hypothetical protein [Flavobacterium sp. JXAS1]
MDTKNFNIGQAYYGDIGKSHGCIASTFRDSDLNSFLTAFTDRPGALAAGMVMEPYLSGIRFGSKYIFTKTFPDPTAARGGMVFTHVLIVELSDIAYLKDFRDVLKYFVGAISNQRELDLITFAPSIDKTNEIQEFVPLYIQKILNNIIADTQPVVFCGRLSSFEEALGAIWPGLPLELRKNFSFTAGFSPSSLDTTKTIIYFQENLKPILRNSAFIDDEQLQNVKIESEIEKFVFCKNADNLFEEFINDLSIQLSDWSTVRLAVKTFQLYQRIDLDLSQDEIRLLVRNVAKLSPESSSGRVIKNKIISKFSDVISLDQNSNIKSLSNLVLDGFSEGKNSIGSAIEKFINKAFHSENDFQCDSMDELLKLTDEHKSEWWRNAVLNGFSAVFNKIKSVSSINAWKIFLKPESSMVKLLSFIAADKDIEKVFIECMPKSINSKTAEKIALSIRDKNWFLLHAHLLLHYLSAAEATKMQIEYERNAHSTLFEGSNLLLKKLSDAELLTLALDVADDLLIKEYADRALIKPNLLKELDAGHSVWLKIWSESLKTTKNLAYGVEKLSSILGKVVNLIKKGIAIPDLILLLFSESKFSDLSGYENRHNIWNNLPVPYLKTFQKATAIGCMEKILEGVLTTYKLESEISAIISSDDFITNFLSENRSNMSAVLVAFFSIEGLKDTHLSDYICYYKENLTELESSKLGSVVFEKGFARSARQIFEKAKHNKQYLIALNNCKAILSLSIYEMFTSGHLFGWQVSEDAVYSEILKKAVAMYPQGPEHGDIWKRAGGDISKFINQKSREENWKYGISLLRNGGGGVNLSAGSLLKIMLEDYPQNYELMELKKYFK